MSDAVGDGEPGITERLDQQLPGRRRLPELPEEFRMPVQKPGTGRESVQAVECRRRLVETDQLGDRLESLERAQALVACHARDERDVVDRGDRAGDGVLR
ncbi:hypothetical protein ACIRBZ_04430 [Streptomyces sp. NPDC094038]|uniref:hypothetical protein n=1 Tax=Streptomyces sp. NPDC094038 TaxID=3366055 RepID=UPI003829BA09